nr:hypothetical protein [Tanacetum cinerariifolium]
TNELGVVAYGVVTWTQKRGANRDQHSRDQRGRWFFKAWGIVTIPHRPSMGLVDGYDPTSTKYGIG